MTHVCARAAIVGIAGRDAAFRAGSTSPAFELAKLADLHDRGVITDAEFEQRKEEIQG